MLLLPGIFLGASHLQKMPGRWALRDALDRFQSHFLLLGVLGAVGAIGARQSIALDDTLAISFQACLPFSITIASLSSLIFKWILVFRYPSSSHSPTENKRLGSTYTHQRWPGSKHHIGQCLLAFDLIQMRFRTEHGGGHINCWKFWVPKCLSSVIDMIY